MANLPALALAADLATLSGRAATDPKLLKRLDDASARFREAVLHDVTRKVEVDLELDGTRTSRLMLPPPLPIISVEAVEVEGVVLEPSAYRLSKSAGYLLLLGGRVWPDLPGSVLVSYTHGYDATIVETAGVKKLPGVPDGIQTAVLGLAEMLLNTEAGVASRTVLGDTVQFGAAATVGVTQQWTDTVENYRVW